MNSFATWFDWPMKKGGELYSADEQMRAILAEAWIFGEPHSFYRCWNEGVKCGRVFRI